MKTRQRALKPMLLLIFLSSLAIVAQAQSPFSVETTTNIDNSAMQGNNEPAPEEAEPGIEKIGWVRNDMGERQNDFVVISRSTVNVRSGPGTGFAILQAAGRGDKYPFIRQESGWYAMQIGFIDFDEMAQAWLRNDMAVSVKKIISVTKDKVNLRDGPSTSYKVIGKTSIGRTHPLLEEKTSWYRIALMSAEQMIPPSDPQELAAAQSQFTDNYGEYTRLVQTKGRNHADTQAALTRFRDSYGVYSILAKGSEALKNVRASGEVDKVVIDKKNFTSTLYSSGKIVRIYPIAYGANPDAADKQKVGDKRTPEGAFEIINRAKNPVYKNIPGGAENNPLGTRWMGLNTWRGSIGMHGTSAPSSIGSRASAGCVRMFTPDAEELFTMVRVSLPVIITSVEGYDHPQPEAAEPGAEPADEAPEEDDAARDSLEPASEPESSSPATIKDPAVKPPKEPEKPEGFWNKIRSFFGNMFS